MSWLRSRLESVVTWVVVFAWAVFYGIALAYADPLPPAETAVFQLVVPPLLWVLAVRFALRHWWSETMDPPQQLLAAAVAVLPERRREWGRAMMAELAAVRGRSARWRFALSSVRATLWLPPASRRPVLVLVAGAGVAATATAGPTVGVALPSLRVFAVTFTGLVAAMAVLAVARPRRRRLWVPAPTALVTGGVVAAVAMTVIVLRREPTETEYLPPAAAICLAAVLAGCLCVAAAAPWRLDGDRFAPRLGAAAGVVFTAWFLVALRTDGTQPPLPLVVLLALLLPLAPIAIIFFPAFMAGRRSGSFRSGLQAAVWTVTTMVPLTYALWLLEGLRRHAIDGRLLDGERVAPVGANLAEAAIFCLGVFPALGFPLAVIGAALGARRTRRTAPYDQPYDAA